MRDDAGVKTTAALLLLLFLFPLGCGGDDDGSGSGPGDPIAPATGQELCGEFADHAAECGWGGNVNGADWNCGDATVVWRADVFTTFAACATDLSCDGDAQTCYQAVAGTEPLAIHDDYATTCAERSEACDLTANGDSSALLLSCNASSLALYANPVLESVIACFDEPCDGVVACLDDVL